MKLADDFEPKLIYRYGEPSSRVRRQKHACGHVGDSEGTPVRNVKDDGRGDVRVVVVAFEAARE